MLLGFFVWLLSFFSSFFNNLGVRGMWFLCVNYSDVTQSYMTSVLISLLTTFSSTLVLRTLVYPWGWLPLPCLATNFCSLYSHISSGSIVWEFTDLVIVLAWLWFLVGGMGKRDRMCWVPCEVPVIATALVGGTRTLQLALLTHPTSWAHHIPVIFCLPCMSYSLILISSPLAIRSKFRPVKDYCVLDSSGMVWVFPWCTLIFLLYPVVWSCLHTRCWVSFRVCHVSCCLILVHTAEVCYKHTKILKAMHI